MTALAFDDPRLPTRFWAKIIPEPNSGCWFWIGATTNRGYGSFNLGNGRTGVAHKLTHRLAYGRLPRYRRRRTVIDHKCRNRCCVNPDHLRALREDVNVAIGEGPTARNARKTHCPRGHAYTEENTTVYRNKRYCRACRRTC